MRKSILVPLVVAMSAMQAQADRIEFKAGDALQGRVMEVEASGGLELAVSPPLNSEDRLKWQSDFLTKPAVFALSEVERVILESENESEFDVNTLVMLANGDTHEGKMVGLTEDDLLLDTEYAGQIAIKRWFVTQLRFPSDSEFAYFGPNRLSEWVEHGEPGDWQLKEGRLVTSRSESIGLEKEGTIKTHLSFDAKWAKMAQFRVRLFANSAQRDEVKESLDLIVSNGGVYFVRTRGGRRINNRRIMGNPNRVAEFNEPGGGRFDIYGDRSKGQVQVWFNGKRLKSWQDIEMDQTDLGGSLILENMSSQKLSFGEIEMMPWDGVERLDKEEGGEEQATLPSSDGDRLVMINGDSVKGKIGALVDGELALEASKIKINVPIERVRLLRLFNPIYVEFAKIPSPRQYNRDVQLQLKSGRRLTFRLLRTEGDKLIGYNEATGELALSLSSFSEIKFGLYSAD